MSHFERSGTVLDTPNTLYNHTVHMSHFERSGTVLDTPNTLVSILNLTTIYCHTNAPECHICPCSPCCISKKRYHSPPQRVSISIEVAFMSTEPPWFGTQGLDASPQGLAENGFCIYTRVVKVALQRNLLVPKFGSLEAIMAISEN